MYKKYADGLIEVICGCMFAGKTEELIRRIKTFEYANKKIIVFKPKIDNRYSKDEVASHAGSKVKSHPISKAEEIFKYLKDEEIIAIDEVQFFDEQIIDICEYLANNGKRVMVAGLDMDFRGEPFKPMPKLLAVSEHITKLQAVCSVCGSPSSRTQRLINGEPAKVDDPIILVGANESYEPRCRAHHIVAPSENEKEEM